jgi:orotidine-5'-phosphate decarboxylase
MTASCATAVTHASDRLLARVARVGAPVCVGLDPVVEKLPAALRPSAVGDDAASAAIEAFSVAVLDAVAGRVPAVKVQAACYERHGVPGVAALARVLAHAARLDAFEVILDFKRGDIGVSADHYAASARGPFAADWTTINGYLGSDGILPFLGGGRGAFALVRTSNPSGDALQSLRLADGRTVAEAVGDLVAATGAAHVGQHGFSDLGAVVGATKRADAAALRARMPQQVFLVPGFGAQGGGVDDVLPCFRGDGRGALVTASRSVIYAFDPADRAWTDGVRRGADELRTQIGQALGARA